MAITFTSNNDDAAGEIIIGGVDTAGNLGGYGPFPAYSISREEIYTEDDTYLNTRYTITINGTASIKPSDSSNPLLKGERQSRVQGEAIIKLQFNRDKFPMIGDGVLKIVPYNDDETNAIIFNDARLTSVSIPESDPSTSVNFQQYSFAFEAYNLDDFNKPQYFLDGVQESWDFAVNDGQFCFPAGNINSVPYKTFTLSHTLSATGRRDPGSSTSDAEAWRQAVKWVESRLVNYPTTTAITTHINNIEGGPKFVPFFMNSEEFKDDIKLKAESPGIIWRTYNPQRTPNANIGDGTYSVTDSWIVAIAGTNALHTLNVEVNSESTATSTTITISGEVQGLNSNILNGSSDNKNNAYTNAETEYSKVEPFIYQAALSTFNNLSDFVAFKDVPLRPTPISKSMGHNKINGVITWSQAFDNQSIIGNWIGFASQDISLSYSNRARNVAKIAILPVIGKSDGPVIQRFNTNTIRSLSITISVVVKPEYRNLSVISSRVDSIASLYYPGGHVSSRSSNYDPATGSYSLSLEWLYI